MSHGQTVGRGERPHNVGVRRQEPIVVNIAAPWFADPGECARLLRRARSFDGPSVGLKRVVHIVVEVAHLEYAYRAALSCSPYLTRGDWVASWPGHTAVSR